MRHSLVPILFGGLPDYLNTGAGHLPKWAIALNKVRTSTGNARILCAGESNTRGVGAGTGGGLNVNADLNAYPKQLVDYLVSRGISAARGGFFSGNLSTNGTDSTMTLGSGWAFNGASSVGGPCTRNSTTTNALTHQPLAAYDQIVIAYNQFTGFDTATVDNGGATLDTINANGTSAQLKRTINTTLSTNAINVKRTAVGTSFDVTWIETRNTAAPKVEVMNAGWAGGGWVNQLSVTAQPWSAANSVANYAADLTIMFDGGNDQVDGVTEAQYKAALLVVIGKAQVAGDVILATSTPYSEATAPGGDPGRFLQARWMRDVAKANGITFVDVAHIWPSTYTQANSMGLMGNTAHPNTLGYGPSWVAGEIGQAVVV